MFISAEKSFDQLDSNLPRLNCNNILTDKKNLKKPGSRCSVYNLTFLIKNWYVSTATNKFW